MSILAPFTDSVLYKDYVDTVTTYLNRQFPDERVWLTGHMSLFVQITKHFLHHFRRAYDETGNVAAAVNETLHSTGRALVITSLVLCGGFFIYLTSYLACNTRFGLLAGCGVLFALAADFFIVPALLALIYRDKSMARKVFQNT